MNTYRNERKQKSMYAVCPQEDRRNASPVWSYKISVNGDEKSQEVGCNSDYTGAFIMDWEIPIEPQAAMEDPGVDFIVDWTN